jgi:hypothetical protein
MFTSAPPPSVGASQIVVKPVAPALVIDSDRGTEGRKTTEVGVVGGELSPEEPRLFVERHTRLWEPLLNPSNITFFGVSDEIVPPYDH